MSAVSSYPTMLSPRHVLNLAPVDLPIIEEGSSSNIINEFERGYEIFNTQDENEAFAKSIGAKRRSSYKEKDGFKICSTTNLGVHSLDEIIKFVTTSKIGSNLDKKLSELSIGEYTYRRYVCYVNIHDATTVRYVTSWVKKVN